MKKIFLVLALAASLQIAGAQTNKAVEEAKKKVESAKAAANDVKKAANMATWIKLGKAYADVYTAAQGNGFVGTSISELPILMNGLKPLSEEDVQIGGVPMKVQHYETADYYIADGRVAMIVVSNQASGDALNNSLEAYKKAHALDVKGKKTKDISDGIRLVVENLAKEAVSAYQLQDFALSSKLFEASVNASEAAPYSQLDTNSIYNAGLTALLSGDRAKAKEMYTRCLEINYFGDEGDVYSRLATILDQDGDKAGALELLEKGFVSFPRSQGILIGLINAYNEQGGNTDRLFELLDVAKQNEPNNASLWYAECDIRLKMTPPQVEEAFAAFEKCNEIDPNYEYGFIGMGVYLYNNAADIAKKADEELDNDKYNALVAQFRDSLKASIEPFEKAFEVSKDNGIKQTMAEYIKQAAFRFRDEPEYQAKYDKYNSIAAGE